MKNEPLISIIIPVFNMEEHLEQCLNSIVNQTYSNLEIICVNDGSTDGSTKIVDSFCKRDPRVVLLNQANQGPLVARDNGLRHCKGEYFFFVDADDYLATNAMETLYSLMERDNTNIAFANFRLGKDFNYRFTKELLTVDEVLSDIFTCQAKMFPCWGMLIRNCQIDYKFKNFRLCEDELYALDLFVDTDKVSFCQDELVFYRDKERKAIKPKDFDYYYEGYLAAKYFYAMVGETRPHLQNNAKCRLLMHTFYCTLNGIYGGFDKVRLKEMISVIHAHRRDVIANKDTTNTIRVLSCVSYLGIWLPYILFRIYTRLKR